MAGSLKRKEKKIGDLETEEKHRERECGGGRRDGSDVSTNQGTPRMLATPEARKEVQSRFSPVPPEPSPCPGLWCLASLTHSSKRCLHQTTGRVLNNTEIKFKDQLNKTAGCVRGGGGGTRGQAGEK